MSTDNCIEKINRHFQKNNTLPLIVDVQNKEDLSQLVTYFNVGDNVFIEASEYCRDDEYLQIESIINDISNKSGNIFVIGFSSFLKLQGCKALSDTLKEVLNLSTNGHVVLLTYQCKDYLDIQDPRLKDRVIICENHKDEIPSFVFSSSDITIPNNITQISGIQCIGNAVEKTKATKIYVKTQKRKSDFPNSIFSIENLNNAYDVIISKYHHGICLYQEYGTPKQWNYALSKLLNYNNWADFIDDEFGNHNALDIVFPSFKTFDANTKWLYFIALKIFGAKKNCYLETAAKKSNSVKDLIKQIYQSILDIDRNSTDFIEKYSLRKSLIACLDNTTDEVLAYCKLLGIKNGDAIYYLTDNTQIEKEYLFKILDKYAMDYSKDEICTALKLVYPELYQYLSVYDFKNDLLDSYFQNYKYQKVINHIFPEFLKIVEDQASKREYKRILEPRSSKIECIDRKDSQLYFVDAMGVEYLGYIMSICSKLQLFAKVTVCSCELPSITSKNKEFLELFSDSNFPIVSIKDIDEIKHHGKDNFDYEKTKLPIHLIKELEIIRALLKKIRERLVSGEIKKAILISDHGASRLAVIHETECIWEMSEKGKHSGRCCLKSDVDRQPEYATDAGEFWVLANYDRFKGSRKSNVEVHGGATLEEVAVPIIELTYMSDNIEIHILPVDATTTSLNDIPEILVSYRKKAEIKIFSTAKLQNVRICIDEKFYDAFSKDDDFYYVEMADIKRAKTYLIDVYSGENLIAKDLQLRVKKEIANERELF